MLESSKESPVIARSGILLKCEQRYVKANTAGPFLPFLPNPVNSVIVCPIISLKLNNKVYKQGWDNLSQNEVATR